MIKILAYFSGKSICPLPYIIFYDTHHNIFAAMKPITAFQAVMGFSCFIPSCHL